MSACKISRDNGNSGTRSHIEALGPIVPPFFYPKDLGNHLGFTFPDITAAHGIRFWEQASWEKFWP